MSRLKVLVKRYWKIYVDPPKESKVFLNVAKLPIMTKRTARQRTVAEPKQVAGYNGQFLVLLSQKHNHDTWEI